MKRTLVVMAVAGAVVATMAWPASAKGEGPIGVRITGPGIGTPGSGGSGSGGASDAGSGGAAAIGTIEIVGRRGLDPSESNRLYRLVSFSGVYMTCGSCAGFIDTSPPKDRAALGPVYRITYFAEQCCDHAVRQLLYPFAPGGPVTYTTDDPGTRLFLASHRVGWWHADGRMGVLFLRLLHGLGVPATNPVAAAPVADGAAAAGASSGATTWRVVLAVGVLALLLLGGAMAARPKSSAARPV